MHKATLLCIAATLAAAGTASNADAAARTLTRAEQAKVARMTQNHRNFETPRTMKDAERTTVTSARGATSVAVPLELYSQLGVRTDANGKLEVVEVEGTDTAIPAATSGVASE